MPYDRILPTNARLDPQGSFGLPYAAGSRAGGFVFLSGMVAVDPDTGLLHKSTVADETTQILGNMAEILSEIGSSLDQVVKSNVFLLNMLEMDNMNAAYKAAFPQHPPARTVAGAVIRSGMNVEIECIALAGANIDPSRTRAVITPTNPLLNSSQRHRRPHSPGIDVGDLLFLSGMVPIDPSTGERKLGQTRDQISLILSNMAHLLESSGTKLESVLKLNVTLSNMLECDEFYRVMRTYFPSNPPACTVVGMQLGYGHAVEIEGVACR